MNEDSRRVTMLENPSSSLSSIMNFNSVSNVNAMLQAKHELREEEAAASGSGGGFELVTADSDGSLGRKRRPEQELSQMGSYLLQSNVGSLPASHASNTAAFWMVAGHGGNQGVSGGGGASNGDPIWAIPSVGNSGVYRGAVPAAAGGIHFMNFASPMMPFMPGSQLGSSLMGNGGGGSGGSAFMGESNLGMLSALNGYRQNPANGLPESPTSARQHHGGGGGDDGHDDSTSQHP